MNRFKDRSDAGRQLAEALKPYRYRRPVVLGIPRGGVPVAAEVARELGGDLGVVVARKLRAPGQPELAIGAVTADGATWINTAIANAAGAGGAYLEREIAHQVAEARRREEAFDGHRRPAVKGRVAIIVDDGIATGATAIAAARAMRAAGAAQVVLAVPVAPPETLRALRPEVDAIVCPHVEEEFWAIGQFYEDFRQVGDEQVKAAIRARNNQPATLEDRVPRDGIELAVRLRSPSPGAPLVTFVHGLGSSKDSERNVVIAERLVDSGMATLLFDLSGHGESGPSRHGDIDAYTRDLAAVEKWANDQGTVDLHAHAIAGSSLGAVVAVRATVQGTVTPSAIVLRAPPLRPDEYAGLSVPTLVIVGSCDSVLEDAEAASRIIPMVELHVIPGASHLFEEPGTLEAATRLTVDWLASKLLPTTAATGT